MATWHVRPQDQGQIVEVAYAADGEYLYRRTTDRNSGAVVVERVSWDWISDDPTPFEPWNNVLPSVDEDDWEAA